MSQMEARYELVITSEKETRKILLTKDEIHNILLHRVEQRETRTYRLKENGKGLEFSRCGTQKHVLL